MLARISTVSSWLISVTRAVLRPLAWSILFRHLYFASHLGLLFVGAWAVGSLGVELAGGAPTPWSPVRLIFVLIALSLAKALFSYLEHFLGHLVAFKALEILRVELYRRLVPLATQIRSTSGDLLTRATKDIDRIEVFFAHTLAPAVTALTVPLAAIVVGGIALGWPIALTAAAGLALNVFLVPWLGAKASLQEARTLNTSRADIAQHITDSIQGMAEVTGYGHVEARLREMDDLADRSAASRITRGRWDALRTSAATALALATLIVVVVVGVITDVGPVGVSVSAAVVWGLFDVTGGVREFVGSLDASLAAAERVHHIATMPPRVTQPDAPEPLPEGGLGVTLSGISYVYPSRRARDSALTDVHLEIQPGSHTSIVGRSGSGKSTLLKLITRFDDPTTGQVTLGGRNLRQLALDDLRSRVVLVEQASPIFNGTVAHNLRLAAPTANDDDLRRALEVAALWDELAERDGLATQVGEQGKLLSGGQRQRLALARAVLTAPRVLLLDEFTSHLDEANAATVRTNLREAFPDITIVESTHTTIGLDQADQIVLIDHGRIHAAGTFDDVRDSGSLIRLMVQATSL